ncbi:hypothetical protein AU468_02820 [Alkalispirochaeta sphaeroplastigenens]|uniref:Uncharacterized protein n=1 Tax=Alkalispirochaeta sphaeroplastigenens TaxID=1187066 RepID=A0A2S4JYX1_9SPIO|nr:hypothetical protein AU468_02820 [Alkalispirochaeta sphaeroplastigenens]
MPEKTSCRLHKNQRARRNHLDEPELPPLSRQNPMIRGSTNPQRQFRQLQIDDVEDKHPVTMSETPGFPGG